MNKTRLCLSLLIAYLTYRGSQCKFSTSPEKFSMIDSSYLSFNYCYQEVAILRELL